MDNSIFADDRNIPLNVTHHNEDHDNNYDNYITPNTSRVNQTQFTMPASADK